MSRKTPRNFFKPLAIGAPEPMRELPVRLERMIHFVPSHLDKVRARVPDIAPTVDVVLANLEDAIPSDAKDAARAGAIEMAQMYDWQGKGTGFWSRVNPLNSPWFQDDVSELVLKAGHQLDVIMLFEKRTNLINVDQAIFAAHPIVNEVVKLARDIERSTMTQVAAMTQVKGQHLVARLQKCEIGRNIRRGRQ